MSKVDRPVAHTWSMAVGRVLGVEIRLHITFLLLLLLLGSWGMLGWLLVVFACVVAHELAHCAVAKRAGAGVDEILLLPIGGVSRIRNLGDDPAVEAPVAAAGPLASLGISVTAAAAAVVAGRELWPPDLYGGALLARIAWFNLLLAGFNLLPAFPLDGGRLFRALLSRRCDAETATRAAATAGPALAGVMFVVGMLWNTWLVFIAVFVYFRASAEEAAAMVHVRARGLHVADVMIGGPVSVHGHARVGDVRAMLRSAAQPSFPVTENGGYVGIVDAATIQRSDPAMLVAVCADRTTPALDPDDRIDPAALDALEESGRHVLAVARDGQVVGILRDEDIIEAIRLRGGRRG